MTVHPITATLVRVDGWFRMRWAIRLGRNWHWDHNGKPVGWLTRHCINRAIDATSSASLSTRLLDRS